MFWRRKKQAATPPEPPAPPPGTWTREEVGGHPCEVYEPSQRNEHGYVLFVTHGNPLFGDYGTTVYIDTNGNQAGGQRFAVAELEGVSLSDLHFGLPLHGGNLFV